MSQARTISQVKAADWRLKFRGGSLAGWHGSARAAHWDPPKVMTGLMFISELFTLAWFGGAFNEHPTHFFYTVGMMAKKEEVTRIHPA
ncbi:hypothetical protein ACKC5O_19365 [Aeromonas schubertii]|uniref:hypothetical protein n=1 Tax=Aeromonas schubertii TaxID=652 RepID=UPI0038B5996E